MKFTSAPSANSRIQFDIEVEWQEFQQQDIKAAYRKLVREVNVPGFRRGKAPMNLLERKVGRPALLEEARDLAIERAYREALREANIVPLHIDEVNVTSFGDNEPLRYTVLVDVAPEVTLGNYLDLHVDVPEAIVPEEDIVGQVEELQRVWTVVEPSDPERAVAESDEIEITFARVDRTGAELEAEQDGRTIVGAGANAEIDRALLGHRTGDVVVVEIPRAGKGAGGDEPTASAPTEQPDSAVAATSDGDAEAVTETAPPNDDNVYWLRVRIAAVHARSVPAADDDLAQTVGGFETIDELRESILKTLKNERQREIEQEARKEAVLQALARTPIEAPHSLIGQQLDETMDEFEENAQRRYHLSLQDYLRVTSTTVDKLRETFRESAERRVKTRLMLDALAKREHFVASDVEIDDMIRAIFEASRQPLGATLSNERVRHNISARLARDMATDYLLRIATHGQLPRSAEDAPSTPSAENEATDDAEPEPSEAAEALG